MIEMITGTPGAGKTTYAVAERLLPESQRELVVTDAEVCLALDVEPGHKFVRRVLQAGIRGLTVEHEVLGHQLTRNAPTGVEVAKWNAFKRERDAETGKEVESDEPVFERLPGEPALEVPACVQNWWLWCKPGDLIMIDEAQWLAPRATMGKKPPAWIMKLEVHRHYGVDFILTTQDPGLIDTTIRKLVGMHRHVRSVMGSPICMVYTWDHASNPERYNTADKSVFRRRGKHYKLFRSAVAHVKPPASGRWALYVVPVLLSVFGFGFYNKVQAWVNPSKPVPVELAAGAVASVHSPVPAVHARASAPRPRGFVDVPKLQGCFSVGERCECISEEGRPVRVALPMCKRSASSFDGLVAWEPRAALSEDDRRRLGASAPPAPSSASGVPPSAFWKQ